MTTAHDIADLGSLKTHRDIEDALSNPTAGVVDAMSRMEGDLLLLGVAGKMGPTLALMAKRACEEAGVDNRTIGVARFSDAEVRTRLERAGIETIRGDLLDREFLLGLPDAPNIIYLAGRKFGSAGNEGLTWAMNCYLPGLVCERFAHSRIAAFSTGNVYAMRPVTGPGSVESDEPGPVGDYAMSCLGRERVFDHFSRAAAVPVVLIRLNYAVELRYGVLVDLARQVWAGRPVDLTMGYFNAIWQPDANAAVLQSIEHAVSPAEILNLTGPDILSVRQVCTRFGQLMDREVRFTGTEAEDAFLSDSSEAVRRFGPPQVSSETMTEIIAAWVMRDGITWDKPTHFEARDGKY